MSWQAYWDNEGLPPQLADPADFASLLEMEPLEEEGGRAIIRPHLEKEGVHALMEQERDKYKALYLAEQQMRRDDAARMTTLEKGISSAASRIKELEGVLVAVRAKASAIRLVVGMSPVTQAAVDAITSLINETLDPCKPWCVLEPGHGGACCPQEDERE